MKEAQVDEMKGTVAGIERNLQPGRWEEGASDEEARGEIYIFDLI